MFEFSIRNISIEKANISRVEKLLIMAGMDLTNKLSLCEQAKKVMKLFNNCDMN